MLVEHNNVWQTERMDLAGESGLLFVVNELASSVHSARLPFGAKFSTRYGSKFDPIPRMLGV